MSVLVLNLLLKVHVLETTISDVDMVVIGSTDTYSKYYIYATAEMKYSERSIQWF